MKQHILRGLFCLLLFAALAFTVSAEPSDWAREEVAAAEAAGLVPFYLSHDYQKPITREQFCDLLLQSFFPNETGAPASFSDCKADSVAVIAAKGIVNGFSDGTFRPNDLLTREQAAAILWRLQNAALGTAPLPAVQTVFADSILVGPWAEPYVSWCCENAVMNGVGGGSFDPRGTYTREQSILTVYRLWSEAGKQEQPPTGETAFACGPVTEKRFTFEDGARVRSGRVNGAAGETVVFSVLLDKTATLRSCEDGTWQETRLGPETVGDHYGFCIYLDDENTHVWLYIPQQYRKMEQSCLEYLPEQEGYLQVTELTDGYLVRMYARPTRENCVADYLVTASTLPLFPWDSEAMEFLKEYTMKYRNGKWCYDAYYYPSPATYRPTGRYVFYRNTAAYHIGKLEERAEQYPGCRYLVTALLHNMKDLYNEAGFIPQENESSWLTEDYGIGSGYYDTRWNSDLMETWLHQCRLTGDETSRAVIGRYMDYYLQYAGEHHWETASGGWLVQDYWHPAGGEPTHCSLNHQLAELCVARQAAELLERPELAELADRMLLGVTDHGTAWLREDGDLHYAYLPDGTFGLADYPYLTYNDLLRTQEMLAARDPVLQMLMDSKKDWMDRNNITEYAKKDEK